MPDTEVQECRKLTHGAHKATRPDPELLPDRGTDLFDGLKPKGVAESAVAHRVIEPDQTPAHEERENHHHKRAVHEARMQNSDRKQHILEELIEEQKARVNQNPDEAPVLDRVDQSQGGLPL